MTARDIWHLDGPETVAVCTRCGRGFITYREGATDQYAPRDRYLRGEFKGIDPRDWPTCGGKIVPVTKGAA